MEKSLCGFLWKFNVIKITAFQILFKWCYGRIIGMSYIRHRFWYMNKFMNKFINQIRAPGGHIQITIMIDTQQQYK